MHVCIHLMFYIMNKSFYRQAAIIASYQMPAINYIYYVYSVSKTLMLQVIFTKEVDLFTNLENRQHYRYIKKYGIVFDDHFIEYSFKQLMSCCCKKCNDRPEFAVFDQLATHMEETHRLYACPLCIEHLKVNLI